MDKNYNKPIIVGGANANNLKNVSATINFNELTVCVGVSGSGKSSFAFNTLIDHEKCTILNLPKDCYYVSQKISDTKQKYVKLKEIIKNAHSGCLLVVDEPLAGTTETEANKISSELKAFAKQGSAVVVVEHRPEIIRLADTVLAFGPGAGKDGGKISAVASSNEYIKSMPIINPTKDKNKGKATLFAKFSQLNNRRDFAVSIKTDQITAITGGMDSNKQDYTNAIFFAYDKSIAASRNRKYLVSVKNKSIIRRPYTVDASPVSKNSRSTVATYYGLSNYIKLEDRNQTITEALRKFVDDSRICRRLQVLEQMGLDYLSLDQPTHTLSGGECQRLKLAKLLCKKLGDRCIYIFDNPVRGLGTDNIVKTMAMFDNLVRKNNTVLITENDPLALQYVDNVIISA